MTKEELVAKRTLALKELKDIEEALSLDEHYIDLLEEDIRNKKLAIKNRNAEIKKLKKQLELEMSVNNEPSAMKKIRELEKENLNLVNELTKMTNTANFQQAANMNRYFENKELKKKIKKLEKGNKDLEEEAELYAGRILKADELLKKFVFHYNNKTIYVENMKPLLEQAEQFINEVAN